MIKAYPEVENVFSNIPAREFENEEAAITYFRKAYGVHLQAIVNEESVKLIWSKK
jgi:hypothetical protein